MIASKIVILAVVVLTVVAAADAFRGEPKERIVREERTTTHRLLGPRPEYVAAGEGMHTRIERLGREFLSEEQIDDAFPAPLEGLPCSTSRTPRSRSTGRSCWPPQASADRPIRAAVELWRNGSLVSADRPTGAFGGGLGSPRTAATSQRSRRTAGQQFSSAAKESGSAASP